MATKLGARRGPRQEVRRVRAPFIHAAFGLTQPRYPKQQRLLALKKAAVAATALPPSYLPLSSLSLLSPSRFDVILVDPPFSSSFSWDTLAAMPIPALGADPSFIFMWVGSGAGEGLERGRDILAKWGYRRCEDVVWIKTNRHSNPGPGASVLKCFHCCPLMFLNYRQTHRHLRCSHALKNIVSWVFAAPFAGPATTGLSTATSVRLMCLASTVAFSDFICYRYGCHDMGRRS
jgi:hypothetical protein